jgi:hypothetical protein
MEWLMGLPTRNLSALLFLLAITALSLGSYFLGRGWRTQLVLFVLWWFGFGQAAYLEPVRGQPLAWLLLLAAFGLLFRRCHKRDALEAADRKPPAIAA